MKSIILIVLSLYASSAIAHEKAVYLDCQMTEEAVQGAYRKTIMHRQENGSPFPIAFSHMNNTVSLLLDASSYISSRTQKPLSVEVRSYRRQGNLFQIEVLENGLEYGRPRVLISSEVRKVNQYSPSAQYNSLYLSRNKTHRISISCGLNLE